MNDADALAQIGEINWQSPSPVESLRLLGEHNAEASKRNWKTSERYWKTHHGRAAGRNFGNFVYTKTEEEEADDERLAL